METPDSTIYLFKEQLLKQPSKRARKNLRWFYNLSFQRTTTETTQLEAYCMLERLISTIYLFKEQLLKQKDAAHPCGLILFYNLSFQRTTTETESDT